MLTHAITRAVIGVAARGVCLWRATIERLIDGEAIQIIVAKGFVADTVPIRCEANNIPNCVGLIGVIDALSWQGDCVSAGLSVVGGTW